MTPRVLIVGAGVAGVSTAETLRAEGFDGAITILGGEAGDPYQRPEVSKRLLGGQVERGDVTLCTQARFDELGIDYYPNVRAVGVDLAAHRVRAQHQDQAEPRSWDYDAIVIATGGRARRLSSPRGAELIRTLRTIDDAEALKHAFQEEKRVVILGAGILGCEIASSARAEGLEAVLVGRAPEVAFGSLGGQLSPPLVDLLATSGVELRLGRTVTDVWAEGSETLVALDDGSRISAGAVVAAIGAEPNVDWLSGSGLDTSDGILCDAFGRAADAVYAVGDVARWRHPTTGLAVRTEHQMNAIEHGQAVARHITHGTPCPPTLPFYWSELFGTRIIVHGTFDNHAPLRVIAGSPSDARFVLESRVGGVLQGVVGWNMPREFRQARQELVALTQQH